ncbi:hypothetical protein [uncultured Ruminococcus sp.]|uniref:hypothetical protein n=1 Tax=uncultured Ruminococcus sp. TaxID=165186 RepID=UPI0025FB92EA|nr:hypothetical protein [uncultured Ruminococcus sp.]
MNKRLITTGDIELIHRLARKVFMTIFVQGGSEQKHLNYVLDRFGQLIYAQGIESCREDIRAMASVVDKKVLGLFREGVMCSDKLLAVAESVSDKFLLELFAEAVRNKMDIYDNKIRMSALLDKNGSDKLGGICFGEGGVERYDLDGEREFDYICARSASYDRYKTEVL